MLPDILSFILRRAMSPVVAENSSYVLPKGSSLTPPLKAPALVLGSPASAHEGSYQQLIQELEQTRAVEKLMVDRLVEGGAYLFRSC